MLTELEYKEVSARNNQYNGLVRAYCTEHKTNALPCEVVKSWPVSMSNDERSQIEVYEFVNDPPERYFAYVKWGYDDVKFKHPHFGMPMKITTWTGESLGAGRFTSNLWTSNFGDMRITFTVHAINGKVYHGTFYYSAGDYCRMRKGKEG